tara:strand:- start:812 stop:961 length:150 start_codon:yes stop_codon:yes gene_type:complete
MHYLFEGETVKDLYKAPWGKWMAIPHVTWADYSYIPPIDELLKIIRGTA